MAIDLGNTHADLRALVNYLVDHGFVGEEMLHIRVLHDAALDKDNEKNARAFAAATEGSDVIRVAENIAFLPPANRVAVLLHEISHVHNQTFHSEDEEVDTDLWITEDVPEAGYHYLKKVRYWTPYGVFEPENLQSVDIHFLDILEPYY